MKAFFLISVRTISLAITFSFKLKQLAGLIHLSPKCNVYSHNGLLKKIKINLLNFIEITCAIVPVLENAAKTINKKKTLGLAIPFTQMFISFIFYHTFNLYHTEKKWQAKENERNSVWF